MDYVRGWLDSLCGSKETEAVLPTTKKTKVLPDFPISSPENSPKDEKDRKKARKSLIKRRRSTGIFGLEPVKVPTIVLVRPGGSVDSSELLFEEGRKSICEGDLGQFPLEARLSVG